MNKKTFEMATRFGYQSEAELGNVQQRFDNLREPEHKPELRQWVFDKCDMTKEIGDAITARAKATALEKPTAIDKPKSFNEYLS